MSRIIMWMRAGACFGVAAEIVDELGGRAGAAALAQLLDAAIYSRRARGNLGVGAPTTQSQGAGQPQVAGIAVGGPACPADSLELCGRTRDSSRYAAERIGDVRPARLMVELVGVARSERRGAPSPRAADDDGRTTRLAGLGQRRRSRRAENACRGG